MKVCAALFAILLVCSLTECLKLPVLLSNRENCVHQSKFKAIQCEYNGFELNVEVTFGSTINPQVRPTVKLQLDTGSRTTWLVSNYTKLLDPFGQERSYSDTFASTMALVNYAPEAINNLNTVKHVNYSDKSSVSLQAYKNHKFEFNNDDQMITVPIDLYFAEQYVVQDYNIPLVSHGILALKFTTDSTLTDINNCFLYKFLGSNPNYQPMMSFDINWDNGYEQPSCFGLGESLPIKEHLLNPTINVTSYSNMWSIAVSYMQLEFYNGKRIMIKPDTEYFEMGVTVYLNTKGIKNNILLALVDSGNADIQLSEYFVEQMDIIDRMFLGNNYFFNCKSYSHILPMITIGLENGNITIPPSKLYQRVDPPRCYPLMTPFPSRKENEIYIKLGLPFFASAYIEMKWKDTRSITPANWDQIDYHAMVTLTAR